MFVTNDEGLYEQVLTLSNHGRSRTATKQFWPEVIGYKFKMSNVQAALGCAQLERVNDLVHRKREILSTYRRRLEGSGVARMNPEIDGSFIGAWMPTVVYDAESGFCLQDVQQAFYQAGIDARVFFSPLSSLPMLASERDAVTRRPEAYSIPSLALNLPSFHDMTDAQINRVVHLLKTFT